MKVDLTIYNVGGPTPNVEIARFDGDKCATKVYFNITTASYRRVVTLCNNMYAKGSGHFSPLFTVFGWRYTNYRRREDDH